MVLDSPQQAQKNGLLKEEPGFSLFVKLFKTMNKEKDLKKLEVVGGVRELAKAIGVDVNLGIDTTAQGHERFSLRDREEVFGKNTTKALRPRRPFEWTKQLIRRHILTPHIISGIISTILGLSFKEEREDSGWIVAAGIWAIALLVILTSTLMTTIYCIAICCIQGLAMDFQLFWMQGQTDRKKDVFDVTVLRDGREQRIKNLELLVGDILLLTKGDIVAADGVLFMDSDLFINEEVVTGESTPIKKKLVEDPFCRSGTQVTNGSGRILVTAVGEDSEFGQTMKMVSDATDHNKGWTKRTIRFLRKLIPVALCLGILVFIILLIRWMVDKKGFPVDGISDKGPVQFLILAIVIMVPELRTGNLLFAHFGLLYVTRKCAKDNIIIRKPNEVVLSMQNIHTICFDKTGTLTENKMTVVKGWFQGMNFERAPKYDDLDPLASELIIENASLNSEAFFDIDDNNGSFQFVGNQTDCALLIMAEKLGVSFSEVKMQKRQYIIKNYRFNSEKKMSSAVIRHGDLLRLYNKGAAEMVLNKCTAYIDSSGSKNPIFEDKRIELENIIQEMATRGLRTLALSYVDLEPNEFNFNENGEPLDESIEDKRGFAEAPEEDLVLLAIVGIKDPIREGVSEVVEHIKKANITVTMITGDSLDTAKQVATECGILTSKGLAMQGREFRQRVEEDVEGLKRDLLQLQVLARSSPSDKQKLVELLKSRYGRVVVCGDGTNDARAMKESTFGIAMGTNSTEVAREAADMVVLNDNISSILTLYLWSRRSYLSFQGYYQFRMSVSLVVWIVVLVSVCVGGETPLSVHQFLWANFIIETLIVLAFATERPPSRVPDDDSYQAREEPIMESSLVHVFFQSLYQSIVIICSFYSLSSLFERYGASSEDEYEAEHDLVKMRKNSLMFNIFVFMQLFNSLNCRKVFHEYNIFEGLFNSPLSLAIRLVTVGLQLLVMLTPMRTLFKVTKLNAWEWLYSIGVSLVVIPLSTWTRYIIKYCIRHGIADRLIEWLDE